MREIAASARAAARELARAGGARRTAALEAMAAVLRERQAAILDANAADVTAARQAGTGEAMLDRLSLSPARVEAMARAVEEVSRWPDPVGRTVSASIRPNGLRVARVRIPLGVVAVIYEARPNVTSDAAALALRSGNAILLRGGSDARCSNRAIGESVCEAVRRAGLPEASVRVLAESSREDLASLLTLDELIDVVIPRGGEGLIRFVSEHARIPVIKHYRGVCHVFLDATADGEMAVAITVNAKASRPSVCNAAETLLVHADSAQRLLPPVGAALIEKGVTLHACERSRAFLPSCAHVVPATEADWAAEYLSLDLAVRVVDHLEEAVAHIGRWGSDHTESIVTESIASADRFVDSVQSSCVMVNASTRFADGGELGLGAEIGISTSKLHAYGPMGADELTTTRFVVHGAGQIR